MFVFLLTHFLDTREMFCELWTDRLTIEKNIFSYFFLHVWNMIDLKSLTNRLGFRRTLHEISLIPLVIFRSILRYNFSVIYLNGTIQTYERRSPTVQLLLSRDYVHYVDPNELWIPWKKFGQLAYCYEHIVLLQYSLKMNAIVPLMDARKTDFRILTWNFP